MTCEHLRAVEQSMTARGITETYRGKPWSMNCREWVYFDCWIDTAAVIKAFSLPACVTEHVHRGTHDGSERGLVCAACNDAVMGRYEAGAGVLIYKGD